MDIDAPGIASTRARVDLGAADIGELDRTALDGAVVDVAVADRIDLDCLLTRIDDRRLWMRMPLIGLPERPKMWIG